MDQENANYFTTDSTFSVPIILSSDGLDTFTNSGIIGDNDPLKIESKEISQILQNDISQEENLINSINCKTLLPDTVSIELKNVEQAQNLKVHIYSFPFSNILIYLYIYIFIQLFTYIITV